MATRTKTKAKVKTKAKQVEAPPASSLEGYRPEPPRPLDATAGKLWQKILDDPDDLATRAVFADRLMEQGDPLGEHVQLALELEKLETDDARRAELEERLAELRRRHIVPWTRAIAGVASLHPHRMPPSPRFGVRRGLVEAIACETGSLDALPDAARVAPIRALEVASFLESDPAEGWVARLAAMPELARVRDLELDLLNSEADLLTLLGSPHLRRLERLALKRCPATPATARAIATCKACAELGELSLEGDHGELGAEGARALASLPLRVLHLGDQGLGAEGAAAIAGMTTLRSLSISNDLGPTGGRALAASPALSSLRTLSLGGCDLRDKALAELARSPHLAGLRDLELMGGVNAKALAALLDGPVPRGLRRLGLAGALRAEGAKLLAKTKGLKLESLCLLGASLGDDGAAALARWSLPSLRSVDLGGNGIGPKGMAALAAGPLLAHARELDVSSNKCGTEGGKALAQGKWLAHVRKLRLFYNWMGVLGVRAILEQMPEAEELEMGENNYGAEPFRVAARGLLPRLRALKHGDQGDQKAVEDYLASGHAHSLARLEVHHIEVRSETVRLLAALPCLERLSFSFCDFKPGVIEALSERFGGLLTSWPETK
jgi:uncharacterized protein (TIGR02996 family)